MQRWVMALVATGSAALVVAPGGSSAPSGAFQLCQKEAPVVKAKFGIKTTPSLSTASELNGATATLCTFPPDPTSRLPKEAVTIADFAKASAQVFAANAAKSAKVVKGVCTKAVTYIGSDTEATTNAATNKTTMVTNRTDNLFCYIALPHVEIVRVTAEPSEPPTESVFLKYAELTVETPTFRQLNK